MLQQSNCTRVDERYETLVYVARTSNSTSKPTVSKEELNLIAQAPTKERPKKKITFAVAVAATVLRMCAVEFQLRPLRIPKTHLT